MKYLIFCSCGHSLEHHGNDGCMGSTGTPCRCPRDASGALESAVDLANADALSTWRAAAGLEEAETA